MGLLGVPVRMASKWYGDAEGLDEDVVDLEFVGSSLMDLSVVEETHAEGSLLGRILHSLC
jgi:hypothetical protein